MTETPAEVATQNSHVAVLAPKPPPAPRAKGIDISSWQHPGGKPIDWHAVKADGVDFVMIKASQGTNYVNPYFAEDCHAAHLAGLIVGGYHFYEQGENVVEQADTFVNACIGHTLELGPWIDWEPNAMPDYQVQGDYDALRLKITETRGPTGLYCDLYWIAIFRRLNLVIPKLWLGEWTAITDTQGVSIIQRPVGPVKGIVGPVDIDELLSVRGVSLPRATIPAPSPTVAAVPAEVSTPVEEQREPDSEKVAEAADPHLES